MRLRISGAQYVCLFMSLAAGNAEEDYRVQTSGFAAARSRHQRNTLQAAPGLTKLFRVSSGGRVQLMFVQGFCVYFTTLCYQAFHRYFYLFSLNPIHPAHPVALGNWLRFTGSKVTSNVTSDIPTVHGHKLNLKEIVLEC